MSPGGDTCLMAMLLRLSSLNLFSLQREGLGRKRTIGSWKGELLEGGKGIGGGGGPPQRPTSGFSPGMELAFTVVRGTNPLPAGSRACLRWQSIQSLTCSSIHPFIHSLIHSSSQSVIHQTCTEQDPVGIL